MILDRHAPFDLDAIAAHLKPVGYLVTQQVGERNMACVKAALQQKMTPPPVQRQAFTASGLLVPAFMEYDVEYVVRDIESLLFWLQSLTGTTPTWTAWLPWPARRHSIGFSPGTWMSVAS